MCIRDSHLAPPDGPKWVAYVGNSTEEILSKLDENAAAFRAELASANDDSPWMHPWSLLMGGPRSPHYAPGSLCPRNGNEPPRPPPWPTQRLLAPPRHLRPHYLRSLRRRTKLAQILAYG